jgi:H+/gluconate symporter-like permease
MSDNGEASNSGLVIIFVIVIILVICFAWYWEKNEIKKLESKPTLDEVPPEDQIRFLQEMSCFGYTEGVAWRMIVIGTLIASLVISLYLRTKLKVDIVMFLSVAVIIAVTFTIIGMFKNYHIDRVVCMKTTPDAPWFHPVEESAPSAV